jgi:leucyl aminopeptidase
MEITVVKESIYDVKADAVVMMVFSDEEPTGELVELDKRLDGKVAKLIDQGEISGKFREFTLIHTDRIASPRVLIMGVGKKKDFTFDKIRSIAGRSARILRRIKALNIAYSSFTGLGVEPELAGQCITEGVILGLYHFKKYITTRKDKTPVNTVTIAAKNGEAEALKKGIEKGKLLAEATVLARDLTNEPGGVMTPVYFVERAKEVAAQYNLEIEVLEADKMLEMGMGALMAVAQGSNEPAKMVYMKYNGKPGAPVLGIVGKGITFDSGGLDLKPGDSMIRMYSDCAGACSTLGAIKAIASLKLPVNVAAIMPLTENMPSGTAFRPGDILKSYSGKTIEVLSTDAEGRLILADAMTYIQEKGVDYMIDIATLTGGCVVALGYLASGIMGNSDKLIEMVKKGGETAGENMWQLPLFDDYFAQIHSDVADMENSGGRHASASTAGKFLEQYVENDTPWVHIDIAGTAMIERERTPYLKKPYLPKEGATGVGVRTLYYVAEIIANNNS